MDNKLCDEDDDLIRHKELTSDKFQPQIVWKNVFLISLVHALALVGLFYSFFRIRWITLFIGYGFTLLANLLGITAGLLLLIDHNWQNVDSNYQCFVLDPPGKQAPTDFGLIVPTKPSCLFVFFS